MMDSNVEKKQELIDWIKGLDSPAMLDAVQRLKISSETFYNDKLPDEPAASVEKGIEDSKAGRDQTSKEFWDEIQRRRK